MDPDRREVCRWRHRLWSYVFDATTQTFSAINVTATGTEGIPAASFSNTCDGSNCDAYLPTRHKT
ncbi:hypothetical protein ACFODQ_04235 [Comamonas sp. JC664]